MATNVIDYASHKYDSLLNEQVRLRDFMRLSGIPISEISDFVMLGLNVVLHKLVRATTFTSDYRCFEVLLGVCAHSLRLDYTTAFTSDDMYEELATFNVTSHQVFDRMLKLVAMYRTNVNNCFTFPTDVIYKYATKLFVEGKHILPQMSDKESDAINRLASAPLLQYIYLTPLSCEFRLPAAVDYVCKSGKVRSLNIRTAATSLSKVKINDWMRLGNDNFHFNDNAPFSYLNFLSIMNSGHMDLLQWTQPRYALQFEIISLWLRPGRLYPFQAQTYRRKASPYDLDLSTITNDPSLIDDRFKFSLIHNCFQMVYDIEKRNQYGYTALQTLDSHEILAHCSLTDLEYKDGTVYFNRFVKPRS